jgi:2-oxoglutarate ferredoxin oxidoreductase subunit beta
MDRLSVKSYANEQKPTWCPGCGDYGIMAALKQALVSLGIHPHQVAIVSGIGCGSKLPDYMHANGYMGIHGRPLPIAAGIKLANPDLTVIVTDGDGDAYGIGGNHFIHAARRNIDITHIVENNQIYALTKGQYSPTSDQGFRTTTSPWGVIEEPMKPLELAIVAGAAFVARGAASEPKHLSELITEAVRHPGYSLVDVLQPCVSFNKVNTYEWYSERTYRVAETGHDPHNREAALAFAREWGDRIPVGVIFKRQVTPFERSLPGLVKGPVTARSLDDLGRDTFEALKKRHS